jgi:hypothetical protein
MKKAIMPPVDIRALQLAAGERFDRRIRHELVGLRETWKQAGRPSAAHAPEPSDRDPRRHVVRPADVTVVISERFERLLGAAIGANLGCGNPQLALP